MSRYRWVLQVFATDLRQLISYRVDFWVQFAGSVLTQMGLAYFLWSAVFAYKGVSAIGGYTFPAMMLYYLLVPLVDRFVRGYDNFMLSSEIYNGSLNRYLLYPVSFFTYRYAGTVARSLIALLQLVFGLVAFYLIFDWPQGFHLSGRGLLFGLSTCFASGVLYFFLSSTIEMLAFWVDNVWSLMVLLRNLIQFFGGAMIPLALFPEWAQGALRLTPFPYLLSVPIRSLYNQVGFEEWLMNLAVIALWTGLFFLTSRLVWKYGSRQYSGVGI